MVRAAADWIRKAERAPSGWRRRKYLRDTLSPQVIDELEQLDRPDVTKRIERLYHHPYWSFEPRPSRPDLFDDQEGFVDSDAHIAICAGGNGSGKTYAGAMRAAFYLCEKQPPPDRNTPFWIVGDTYEEACGSCWDQKLSNIIPSEFIEWDRIAWHSNNRNWPFAVPLKPWRDRPGKNWVIEFKSYEQGRQKMQARAIGGAWFTEQFPWEIFEEVLRGCRQWQGTRVWAEFTPVDPEKSVQLAQRYEEWLQGMHPTWAFYRLNTEVAVESGHAQQEWLEDFKGVISDELLQTRLTGEFANYEGTIYGSFQPALHLADQFVWATQ